MTTEIWTKDDLATVRSAAETTTTSRLFDAPESRQGYLYVVGPAMPGRGFTTETIKGWKAAPNE